MPTPASPSAPTPTGDDRNLVPVDENYTALGFEDRLRIFWEKNSKGIVAALVIVVLAIVGKGGWEYLAAQREAEVQRDYAVATTAAQLKSFIAANPNHALAGVAQLRIADEAYTDGKLSDAVSGYDSAAMMLKTGPLATRARLGAAIAKLQSGRTTEGEAALKSLASDSTETKAFRAEAIYHLASHAFANRRPADVKTLSDQLMQLDPGSPWTQRVLQFLAATPVEAQGASATPAISAPAEGAPAIKLPEPKK